MLPALKTFCACLMGPGAPRIIDFIKLWGVPAAELVRRRFCLVFSDFFDDQIFLEMRGL
jgi:hypothetical protein